MTSRHDECSRSRVLSALTAGVVCTTALTWPADAKTSNQEAARCWQGLVSKTARSVNATVASKDVTQVQVVPQPDGFIGSASLSATGESTATVRVQAVYCYGGIPTSAHATRTRAWSGTKGGHTRGLQASTSLEAHRAAMQAATRAAKKKMRAAAIRSATRAALAAALEKASYGGPVNTRSPLPVDTRHQG